MMECETALSGPLALLPGAWHLLPDAVRCPACGGLLAYAVGERYVACGACAWQRRLTGQVAIRTALVASGITALAALLEDNLAALPADALPPAPALLWREVAPGVWRGPSWSEPGKEHTVHVVGDSAFCTCPRYRNCRHIRTVEARRHAA